MVRQRTTILLAGRRASPGLADRRSERLLWHPLYWTRFDAIADVSGLGRGLLDANWVSPSLPRCPGVARTRWLDDGVVGRGSNGEGLLGEAMKEQPAGL